MDSETLDTLRKYYQYLQSEIKNYSKLADWENNAGRTMAAGQRNALTSAMSTLASLFPELRQQSQLEQKTQAIPELDRVGPNWSPADEGGRDDRNIEP